MGENVEVSAGIDVDADVVDDSIVDSLLKHTSELLARRALLTEQIALRDSVLKEVKQKYRGRGQGRYKADDNKVVRKARAELAYLRQGILPEEATQQKRQEVIDLKAASENADLHASKVHAPPGCRAQESDSDEDEDADSDDQGDNIGSASRKSCAVQFPPSMMQFFKKQRTLCNDQAKYRGNGFDIDRHPPKASNQPYFLPGDWMLRMVRMWDPEIK
jgi:hypothetical protein